MHRKKFIYILKYKFTCKKFSHFQEIYKLFSNLIFSLPFSFSVCVFGVFFFFKEEEGAVKW